VRGAASSIMARKRGRAGIRCARVLVDAQKLVVFRQTIAAAQGVGLKSSVLLGKVTEIRNEFGN